MATGGFTDYMVTDPKYAAIPSPAGVPMGMDPIAGLMMKMFGFGEKDEGPDWIEKNGMMHHKSGNFAPVPVSDVPGTSKKPTDSYRQTASQIRELEDFFPLYAKAMAGQIIPQEQAKLAAAEITSPQMAELMKNLYEKYGPQLNKIGTDIARQNALATAKTDADVLKGPGKDVVAEALAAMKIADPEFFSTRAATSGRLQDLLKSIDLEGGLSSTERREIEQGLSRENEQRGTAGDPSQTATVSNAMRYGSAGRTRVKENQDTLSRAIQSSSAFLPASRTGIDTYQIATGKSSGNTGENKFTGVNSPGSEAYQMGGSLFGQIGSNSQQQAQLQSTEKLNEKDWLDQFEQFTGGLANLGSAAGGMAGGMMCWVAREVYGADNPKWIEFRIWVIFKAPMWVFKTYMKHGERFAKFISNKPKIKSFIKFLMDKAIN